MIAIGIIVWGLLIIIMMELTSPGFLRLLLGMFALYGLIYLCVQYLIYRRKNKWK